MLKTYARAPRPPRASLDEVVRIRRLESVFRWIGAGLLVGVTSGAVFGAVYVIVSEGIGAAWFGALIGANFGLIFGAPFGIVLGLVNAALPSPTRVGSIITTARIVGVVLVMSAGYAASGQADGIWLLVAAVGAAAGWAAAPTVVWASVEPVHPQSGAATQEPAVPVDALIQRGDKLTADDDWSPTP